jgi:lysophospholipase L1-like esterase
MYVKKYKNKQKKTQSSQNIDNSHSNSKKILFYIIALSLPLIFFFLLELGLQIFNYAGNLDLFLQGPKGFEKYIRFNPNVAKRYFYMQSTIPSPSLDMFLIDKPDNGYRIFVLGGSTTAGFPYGNNLTFPKMMQLQLNELFPDKYIEVVNTSMSAVNSYTLLDFIDEILEYEPDAILMYAGHNEYYGALGVGSTESLGQSNWLIQGYLKIQKYKSFLLLRDFIGLIRKGISGMIDDGESKNPSGTLMARIVKDQIIPYDSKLYIAGKNQFSNNIVSIVSKVKEKGIPVIISELVSNIRNQKPFISIDDDSSLSGNYFYKKAKKAEQQNNFDKAKEAFLKAKDFDALRFRAPEDFNRIIHKIGKEFQLPVVPMKLYFENESPNYIYGENIFLEHLHPNAKGYFLMAKAFLDVMEENNFINPDWEDRNYQTFCEYKEKYSFTPLDSLYASFTIKDLKESWPFKSKKLSTSYNFNVLPKNKAEEIVLRILKEKDYDIELGHLDMAEYFIKNNKYFEALNEYKSLIATIPQELVFYMRAATLSLEVQDYKMAYHILMQSLKFEESFFALKWIGQIFLKANKLDDAIKYMSKAVKLKSNDNQLLFNLCRAYYASGQIRQGEEIYNYLVNNGSNSAYIKNLQNIRRNVYRNQ